MLICKFLKTQRPTIRLEVILRVMIGIMIIGILRRESKPCGLGKEFI